MNLLKKSLSAVNSSLLLILIIYFLDVLFARLMYLETGALPFISIAPLKILAYGALYGILVEFASTEKLTLEYKHIQTNTINGWKYYFTIVTLPFLICFFLVENNPIEVKINTLSFFAFVRPLFLFILATTLISYKYIKPSGLERRKIKLAAPTMATLFGAFFLSSFIFHLPSILQIPNFELSRITKFIYIYIDALIFSYFVNLILQEYPEIYESFTHKREIYLINPLGGGLSFHLSSLTLRSYPPAFVVIKALTPKTYKFREFNHVFWKKHYYAPDKLVAITCFTSNSLDAYRIAREFKERGSKVVMGGPHVTYFPEEALEYCDSVVCGELESVWPQVIKDYESDNLQNKYLGVPLENCHELVHQELLNSPPEIVKDFLEASRGCKFKCHFCTIPSLSQGKLRKQNIPKFIELVEKAKQKHRSVAFIDNNIYSDPAYAKELFLALKPLNIKWETQCSIDIAKNTALLSLAKESGCSGLLFGLEISEGSFEKSRGGKFAMADHYKEYAKKVKDLGIRIKAHYIFGFESDSFQCLPKFWKLCFAINPFITSFSLLTPFPGSQLYYDTVEKDRISNLNWAHYGAHTLVFRHPRMNNFLLAKTYPLISIFFLFTTSKMGYALLIIIASSWLIF